MSNSLSLKVTLQAIDKITAPLRGIARQSQRLSQAYKSDMQGYRDSIRKTEQALAGVRETQRKLAQAGKPISRASIEAEQALVKRINETNAALQHRKSLMDQEMAAIRRRQAAMDRGKEQFKSGAMKVAAATAAVYAGAKFMQPGFDFDEQMSKVQALTRLDKNDPMFKKLREQAEHLGATTWASATQAADAQAFYAMAGFDPQAIMAAMPATLDLAKAGDVDVGRAADIGSNILSAFGLEPTEMDKVADILVSVFTRTNTSLEMLGETMKYVGPVAKELKIPLEEATAMAGILGNVGIQGSQAGTAMRALQSRLAAPPSGAKKSLEELKVNTKDALGNFRAMPEILADVMKATEKMGNAERLGHLKAIAGEEAGSAFAAFLDKNNYEDLLKVIDAAYNAQSSFADELTASFNNLSDASKEALKSLNIDLLDDNKELREIPAILNEIVEASKNLDQADQIDLMQKIGGNKLAEAFTLALNETDLNNDNFLEAIEKHYKVEGESAKVSKTMSDNLKGDWTGLMSAIESVQIAISGLEGGGLRGILQKITKIVQATSNWIKENPKLAGWIFKIGAGLVAATAAIGSLTMAMGVFNMVVLANPIVLIIAAIIAALATLFIYRKEIWGFFKTFFSAPAQYLTKAINFITNLADTISNFLGGIPVIGPIFKFAFEAAIAPIRIILFLFKQLLRFFSWIGENWGAIKDWLGDMWTTAIEMISSFYNKIKSFLTDLPIIGPLFEALFTAAEEAAQFFWLPFKTILKGIKWIWDNIGDVGKIFAGIWDFIKKAMSPVVDLVKWLYDNIIILIEKFEEFFSFETPQWMKDTGSWVGDKWDGVKSFFGGEEEVKVANNNSLLFAGAALTPALPVNNNRNTTNNNEVNVHVTAQTNAPPQAIGAQVARAVSSSLIGDEY